nr:Glu/Leu/Phe/Val dehydrogenase dimerization domain-containing protein [Fodinicola feengrottensis]
MRFWEHEELVVRQGSRSGIALVVAVHSRVLGPATGGCRLRRYPDWHAAADDALRLSQAMTYKCAAAGLPYGGAKSVIALPERTPLTDELREAILEDLGDLIDSFDGAYLAGPDVGTGPLDMVVIRRRTPHVYCLPESEGGTGSSSGPTAIGVLAALRAGAAAAAGQRGGGRPADRGQRAGLGGGHSGPYARWQRRGGHRVRCGHPEASDGRRAQSFLGRARKGTLDTGRHRGAGGRRGRAQSGHRGPAGLRVGGGGPPTTSSPTTRWRTCSPIAALSGCRISWSARAA